MADPLEDLESAVERGEGINFIPCVKWVRRGVAKTDPDKVKLSPQELAAIIEQTGGALKVMIFNQACVPNMFVFYGKARKI